MNIIRDSRRIKCGILETWLPCCVDILANTREETQDSANVALIAGEINVHMIVNQYNSFTCDTKRFTAVTEV